jgi:hypothetical protein
MGIIAVRSGMSAKCAGGRDEGGARELEIDGALVGGLAIGGDGEAGVDGFVGIFAGADEGDGRAEVVGKGLDEDLADGIGGEGELRERGAEGATGGEVDAQEGFASAGETQEEGEAAGGEEVRGEGVEAGGSVGE